MTFISIFNKLQLLFFSVYDLLISIYIFAAFNEFDVTMVSQPSCLSVTTKGLL